MKTIRSLLLVLLAMLSATSAYSHEMRTWTAMNGSTMEAAFIKYEEPNVHMQKRDGTILKVNRENLSDEDWVYVMQFDPSILSFWIKLGKPTAMEAASLQQGRLPNISADEICPRTSVFVSSDERMCIQSTQPSRRSFFCSFPTGEFMFEKNCFYYDSSYYVHRFHAVFFLQKDTGQLRWEATNLSGNELNQDTREWLLDIKVFPEKGDAYLSRTLEIVLNLECARNSATELRAAPHRLLMPNTRNADGYFYRSSKKHTNNPHEEEGLFRCSLLLDSNWFALGRLYSKRQTEFMKIPRYKRIVTMIQAKKAGAPKEAFVPNAGNLVSSGSGFFVSTNGFFLTNYHVVKGSQKIELMTSSGIKKARVVRIEPDVDLSLLKAESGTYSTLSFAPLTAPTLGEDIFTIGFPMPDIQGFSPKMTKGVISSLNGIQDEDLKYQIDASIQPGNSGGPLVNNNGELVGVIVSSLRDSYIAEKKGVIPQNVNYAIKAKHVIDFLGQVPDCRKQISFSNKPKVQTSATPETIEAVQSACAMVMVFE